MKQRDARLANSSVLNAANPVIFPSSFESRAEECIVADHKRTCSQLNHGREGRIEVAFGAGTQDMELQPEGPGRRLQVLQ